MKKLLFILIIPLFSVFMPDKTSAVTPYIMGPEITIINNNIIVKTSIADIADFEQTITSSAGKEIVFTVELIRVWDFWPDEFMVSKKIRKTIRYDNMREQYLTSSHDGTNRTENKFTDYNIMKAWLFSFDAINLANLNEFDPGDYYIRTIVESKSVEELPLIGSIMHLVPEVEMSLAKESQPFTIGNRK